MLASGDEFLDVRFQVIDSSGAEPVVVDEKRLAFKLETTQEEIVDALKKHVRLFAAEQEKAAREKQQAEKDEKVEETMTELNGLEISLDDESKVEAKS